MTKYKRRDDLVWEIIEGDLIILNHEEGKVITLNETGGAVWDALNDWSSVEEMTDVLQRAYEGVKRDVLKEDVNQLMNDLIKQGLLIEDRDK